ncbi:MAG: PaaI family thioesterase [Halioglobus sp.]|nr:PaaI family thioesterase [Halioglobus sp.]
MTDRDIIDGFNAHAPGFLALFEGKVVAIDRRAATCTFEFNISTDFCHSVDVVQGGFVTAMLDAAMSHAVFASTAEPLVNVSSLEIKTTFIEPTRAGPLRAVGRVLKSTYKTAFLEGGLYDAEGLLTATSSSVAKLVRPK